MKNLAYYRVTINNTSQNSSPSDGFIDFNNVSNYIQVDQVNGIYQNLPSSLSNSLAKTRGYIRYQKIVDNLNFTLNTLGIIDMVAVGADVNTEATSISFTVVYDKPSYIQTVDPITTKIVYDAKAIKVWIATALNQNLKMNYMIFDPTLSINPNVMKGYLIQNIAVGPLGAVAALENTITVNQIDGTQIN